MYNNNNPYASPIPSFLKPVPIIDSDPTDGGLLIVAFSYAWLPVILGAMTQLLQSTTWDSTDAATVQLAQDRAMMLLNLFASTSASVPGLTNNELILYQFDGDTNTMQVSVDGGVTYQDAPGADPRNQSTYPPRSGDNARCDAATNATRFISDQVSSVLNGLSIGLGLAAIVGLILFSFLTLGLFDMILVFLAGLGTTLVGLGASAISAAMTSDVYDQLTCIFYDNMNDSGQLDAASFAQVGSDVDALIASADARTVIHGYLDSLGYGGINNAGAIGTLTGDCTDCGWCYTIDFTLSDGGFVAAEWGGSAAAVWEAGVGWHDNGGFGSAKGVWIQYPASEVIDYTLCDVFFDQNGELPNLFAQGFTDPTGAPVWSHTYCCLPNTGNHDVTVEATQYLQVSINNNSDSTGSGAITKIVLHGTGTNPFGSSNC